MKKLLLSVAAASLALGAFASAPTYKWFVQLDNNITSTKSQNNFDAIVPAEDGFYTLGHYGAFTTSDYAIIYEGDGTKVDNIAYGSTTNTSSPNYNLLVNKFNNDGKILWTIYSTEGYFDNANCGTMIAGEDGSLLLSLKVRPTQTNPSEYTSPVIKDASGAEITFPDFDYSLWQYNQLLVKISKEGYVQWAKHFAMDQFPTGTSSSETSNAVTPYAFTADSEGNIYIGGNFRAPMIVTGAKNATYVFQPRNIATYNGDSQQSAGSLYLIKLDKDGNYLAHTKVTGAATYDQINKIAVSGNTLYFVGLCGGTVGQTLTSNGHSIEFKVASTKDMLVGAVDTKEMKTSMLNLLTLNNKSGKTNKNLQIQDLEVIDGALYVAGACVGGLSNQGEAAPVESTAATLDGVLYRLDATTGKLVDAYDNNTTIGSYLSIFKCDGTLYAYGYRLNATTGAFLDEFPATATGNTFVTSDAPAVRYTIATQGGAPTAFSAAYNTTNGMLYTVARGNNVLKLDDGKVTTYSCNSWSPALVASGLGKASAVESIAADNTDTELTVEAGEGEILAKGNGKLTVTATNGQQVASVQVNGSATVKVAPGLYLANTTKLIVR